MTEQPLLPPLPPPLVSDLTLAEKTLIYWEMMLLRRGRSPKGGSLTIEEAMYMLRLVRDNTNPYRPLALRVAELREEIIRFGGSNGRKQKSRKAKARARARYEPHGGSQEKN
jgi:ribosomal protein L30/L7E